MCLAGLVFDWACFLTGGLSSGTMFGVVMPPLVNFLPSLMNDTCSCILECSFLFFFG